MAARTAINLTDFSIIGTGLEAKTDFHEKMKSLFDKNFTFSKQVSNKKDFIDLDSSFIFGLYPDETKFLTQKNPHEPELSNAEVLARDLEGKVFNFND